MSPSRLVPGSRLGPFPYQIVKAIGSEGNMSEVYLASIGGAPDTGWVVLKISRSGDAHNAFYRETMDNEVERLRVLKHPGVVRIYPIQRDGGVPNLPYTAEAVGLPNRPWFSVMEYLPHGSLTNLFQAGPVDLGLALEIGRALASTLDYLHSRKMVHLDLKPDNILFRTPPVPGKPVDPVLIDFGIARDIGQSGLEARTLQYAAPERLQREKHAEQAPELAARPHPAMDVYALGVILYEMFTGRLPFTGRSRSGMTSEILKGSPPIPSTLRSDVTRELDALLLHMLAGDPAKRPTALQAAILLEELALKGGFASRSSTAAPASPPRASAIWQQVRGPVLAALVVLQLFFILGTYRYWHSELPGGLTGLLTLLANMQFLWLGQSLFQPLSAWLTTIGDWMQQWLSGL